MKDTGECITMTRMSMRQRLCKIKIVLVMCKTKIQVIVVLGDERLTLSGSVTLCSTQVGSPLCVNVKCFEPDLWPECV